MEKVDLACVKTGRKLIDELLAKSTSKLHTELNTMKDLSDVKIKSDLMHIFPDIPTQKYAAAQLQKSNQQPGKQLYSYSSNFDRINKMATGTPAERQYAKIFKLNFTASVDGHIRAKMYKGVNSEELDDQNLKDVLELAAKLMEQHLSTQAILPENKFKCYKPHALIQRIMTSILCHRLGAVKSRKYNYTNSW